MTFEEGEALGCPDCAAGEPHVCPFEYADKMPEPRRTRVLNHVRRETRQLGQITTARRLGGHSPRHTA